MRAKRTATSTELPVPGQVPSRSWAMFSPTGMLLRWLPGLWLLLADSALAQGWLGVYLTSDRDRVTLAEVIPASPAATAGLQVGDVVLAVGEYPVASAVDFTATLRLLRAGTRLSLRVRRLQEELRIQVQSGERPDSVAAAAVVPLEAERPAQPAEPAVPALPAQPPAPTQGGESQLLPSPAAVVLPSGFLGVALVERPQGLQIEAVLPDSPAARALLPVGAVVQRLEGEPVRSLVEFDARLARRVAGDRIRLGLLLGGREVDFTVELGLRPLIGPPQPLPADAAQEALRVRHGLLLWQQRLQQLEAQLRRE
jgi:S1-C subfamily serine protease